MFRQVVAMHRVGSRAISNGKTSSTQAMFQTEAWKLFVENTRRGVEAEVKGTFAGYKIWFLGGAAAMTAAMFSAAFTAAFAVINTMNTINTNTKLEIKREFEMLELKLERGGYLQVSDKERFHGGRYKEVAKIISDLCVDPETKRPYPASEIEKALREHPGFSFKPDHSSRQHALEAITLLRETMKMERAKMRVRVSVPSKYAKAVHGELKARFDTIEEEDWVKGDLTMTGLIPPDDYKTVMGIVRSGDDESNGRLTYLD